MRSASRALLFAIVGAASGGSVAAIGCMGEGTLIQPPADDAEAAAPTLAWLRLANLSPTAANIDFCVAPVAIDGDAGAFQGPLLAQLATRLAAAGNPVTSLTGGFGIPFAQASAYVPVASLQPYVVRVVAGNAGSCAAGVVPDLAGLPVPGPDASIVPNGALATNEFLTIALLGEQLPVPSLQAIALVDDPDVDAATSTSKAYLRFVNAAVGQPRVDVFQGLTKRLFGGVGYGQPPSSPLLDAEVFDEAGPGVPVDRNGYWVTSAISTNSQTIFGVQTSGPDGGAPIARTVQVTVSAGGIVTAAFIGDVVANDAGIGAAPYELLLCVDNGATTGLYATCSVPTM